MACTRNHRNRRRRGVSLMELVGTFVILAFIALGTMQLYRVGDRTQRTARFYSDAQAVARKALQRMTRTVRHASIVDMASTVTNFSAAPDSTASQIIVSVPQPNATGTDHIRFYVSSGTLYAQRNDDTGAGMALATGVQSLTINYYATTVVSSGTTNSSVDNAPASSTEVKITLVVKSGTVTTTEVTYVSLRNRNLGF
jgi:Tfp pilus assembly protein PilW